MFEAYRHQIARLAQRSGVPLDGDSVTELIEEDHAVNRRFEKNEDAIAQLKQELQQVLTATAPWDRSQR